MRHGSGSLSRSPLLWSGADRGNGVIGEDLGPVEVDLLAAQKQISCRILEVLGSGAEQAESIVEREVPGLVRDRTHAGPDLIANASREFAQAVLRHLVRDRPENGDDLG
ncbi:hypothetical protein NLX83_28960 [Allokutzneria sp. A3M-2-11 16]|uniref:hypothetical protein n=1 Tax=Allokutzneria sp. A3M-2-11 16 TaxID=2962043 RepID=UPI0020B758E0|nr:hypothetical protein [Allokutzneria sp. A3M-2-11 16]MCP3803316.1 hypothetical protein [Allokutzneria sp. A3M-2-11 16]